MNKINENVVLTDFHKSKDWAFVQTLQEADGERWICKGTYCGRKTKREILSCFVKYFTFPLQILFRIGRYGKILAWQQFFGLNIAFFSRLFHLKKRVNLYVMTFIYKPKGGVIGKLYSKYIRYIVKSKYIDKFICFSSSECTFYKQLFGVDKFVYVPLGIEPLCTDGIELRDDGYIFSTGRSNRDYRFLIEAMSDYSRDVRIACGLWNYDGVLPSNITLLHDCYGKQMIEEMAHCHCVVIPLKNQNISSGQLVILQAMQLGKPVIITKSCGVTDYIVDGKNGLLINNSKTDLLQKLEQLEDKKFYEYLSQKAKVTFWDKHTLEAMAEGIVKKIQLHEY